MPRCHYTLKAVKPPESAVSSRPYPYSPITLGDYLRKKRLDLGLRQKDLAEILDATDDSVNYWENNLKEPSIQFLPRIIQFIGYYPYSSDMLISEKLVVWRSVNGISQHRMAQLLGIDPGTLGKWEHGKGSPTLEHLNQIRNILIQDIAPS